MFNTSLPPGPGMSIRVHPDQEQLRALFTQAGFDKADYFNMAAGVVAVHRGFKLC